MSPAIVESKEFIESVIKEVSTIVSSMSGIQLGPRQHSMVESRLRSRMLKLGVRSFSDYLKYLKANIEPESQALLSLMTTHHTFFFREFSHFEYLLNQGLERLIAKAKSRGDKKIRVWSAASSRGQEVYSLAMFFAFHLKHAAPDIDFEVWGTDIDPESVAHAKNGVYRADELTQSPAMYISDHWIRGKGNIKEYSKVKDSLKSKCRFEVLNILKPESFLSGKNFDVIFCRNVFIYFNQDQIKASTQHMLNHLDSEGLLFLGVSESLNGLGLNVQYCGPSVYQLPRTEKTVSPQTQAAPALSLKSDKLIEVLCVDDSKAIHALLSKVLTKENGFTIKATAMNGQEAIEIIKTQKFDIMTLDLHMPLLDGLGFLQQAQSLQRPPVVILSAINRDDTSIAQQALKLGASDYIEKPSLENLAQAGNEIRSKIKSILALSSKKPKTEVTPVVSEKNFEKKSEKKKVLIIDDSATIRKLLTKIISEDPALQVVAEAEKPSQVESLIKLHKPDVLTLDIHMPEMDGVTLLKKIYPIYQIPTVMISSISREEGPQVLNALEAGAIDYIQKPQMTDLAEVAHQIRDRIRIAAHAQVKRKSTKRKVVSTAAINTSGLILMGASTGGTEALKEVLLTLPSQIPPILIVQHIPPVFSAAFAKRLNDLCPFEVREAKNGDEIKANQVLVAPGGMQMGIRTTNNKLVVSINDDPPMNRFKPSVDYLFKSGAELGIKNIVAVLLTGMGNDGAKMMKLLKNSGARTIAQNKDSCVVFGMPREAIELGAAEFIVSLEDIGQKIIDLCNEKKSSKAA